MLNLQHTVSWLGDKLAVLSTQSVLKCDWNSSQFCITPVPFNMSEGWDKVKLSLTGHQNLTTEIMDLERRILSTFSRTLPDIAGSDLVKSLQEGLNNLNPSGHVSTLIGTTFGNTIFILLLCCVAFLVFWGWQKGKQLKRKAEKIQTMLQFIKANKKGGDEGLIG